MVQVKPDISPNNSTVFATNDVDSYVVVSKYEKVNNLTFNTTFWNFAYRKPTASSAGLIRRRSYVIIGLVAQGNQSTNKSKKLTRLISPVHNTRGKVRMKKQHAWLHRQQVISPKNYYVTEGQIWSSPIAILVKIVFTPTSSPCTLNRRASVKPCMLFLIRTLPRVLCAGDISRVSFLDLFGPIALGNQADYDITSPANRLWSILGYWLDEQPVWRHNLLWRQSWLMFSSSPPGLRGVDKVDKGRATLPADKDRATMVIDNSDYESKALTLLQDKKISTRN